MSAVGENENECVLGEDVTDLAGQRSRGGTTVLSIRLSLDELAEIESISRATKKTISQVAREAIREALRFHRHSQPQVVPLEGRTINLAEQSGQVVGPESSPELLPARRS